MTSEKRQKMLELLRDQHQFPGPYQFKFIVPVDKKQHLQQVFIDSKLSIKKSKKGNYVSVTVDFHAANAEEVLYIYNQVQSIEGIISL